MGTLDGMPMGVASPWVSSEQFWEAGISCIYRMPHGRSMACGTLGYAGTPWVLSLEVRAVGDSHPGLPFDWS